MTLTLTDTVPQELGVHFSPSLSIKSLSADFNVCVDNSKTTSKASSSSMAYCDPTLCLQEDFIGLQLEESLSSTHYQTIFMLSSSDTNVQDSSSFPLKTEQDSYRQRLHATHDTHGRKVKRELFPGTVSKVLADVNKLWDISVTEDEGVHRLSGRIDGQSLAIPFASDCTLPNLRCISPMGNKLQKSADETVFQLRCLNRQQELLSRAERSRKRLQLLLARYAVDHCSQQISGLVRRKIEKLNVRHNSATHSCTGVQTQPDVVVELIENACVSIKDEATLASSTAIKTFSVSSARVLHCIQQELDSDVTESSSDEDWEEKPKNAHDCPAEWNWLSGRADVGSRWTWLQAQIAELECKIHQLADLRSQLRGKKGTLVFQECSNCILAEDTHLPYPGTSLWPAEARASPPEGKNPPPATDLEMSPSSPTLLLRNIEKQSAQLTQMVSSLITAFPVSLSPTSPDKPYSNGKMAASGPHGTSELLKAGMTTRNGFCKQQLVRKRKRIRMKASSTLRSSSARTRPLLLFHKRNLYRLFPGHTPFHLVHKPVYGSNKSWQPVNSSSIGLRCDETEKPVLVKRDVCEIDPSFHPVLSLPSDLLLCLHLEGLLKRKSDIKDPSNSRLFYPHDDDDDDDAHLPRVPAKWRKRCILSPGPRLELETPDREVRLGNGTKREAHLCHAAPADDLDVTPISQKTSFQLQSRDPSIVLNAARRRVRSESSYDLDNIVIPMNLVAPSKLEKLQYKEILTPRWKEVALEPLKSPPCEELEDLADETFLIRHQKYEQIEKVRWSFWEQRKCPKRSRSSSHSSVQWPGNVLSCTEENYSPNSMSPVSWDTPPLNGWASQNLQFKAEHWERRIFPLTEEAAVALKHLSSPLATQSTPTHENKVVEPLHSSCGKENR
ncbi:KAT8 regulatory NSL complex subunit 1-like protein [Dendrobates tinctorius]|uniref:KAT8 regulatory NSL complex subunit 1-like protein n=1 Tax=Dendrobates tinctorius TaxID=92724 RepID=UPI003CC9CFEB